MSSILRRTTRHFALVCALASLPLFGCAAASDASAPEEVGAARQAGTVGRTYRFVIDAIRVDHRRAPYHDTDVVSVTSEMTYPDSGWVTTLHGDQVLPSVSGGEYATWAAIDDLYVAPGAPLKIGFVVRNAGAAGDPGKVSSVLNSISDETAQLLTKYYGWGSAWDALNKLTHWINDFGVGYCDGNVAGDALLWNDDTIAALTANGPYGEWRTYAGTDSNWGCGSNSRYEVHFTVSRQ